MPTSATAEPSNRIAIAGIGVAVLVVAIKSFAYWTTGSLALYSDALEGLVNVATAIAAAIAIQMARRPADTRHQYGHEKAEYFAAVLEGVLILVAAFLILRDAIGALAAPQALVKPWLGLAISSVATAINGAWGWFLIRRGAELRSPALTADGWHLWTDVVTSLGVLAGLVLATVTGWHSLDAILAGLVALYIVWAGGRIIRATMSSLMDEALATEVQRRIHAVISEKASGAIEAHDIRTRSAGRASYIEFHLVVPGEMSVARSHQICDRLEAALMEAVPGARVLIHVEPHVKAKGDLSGTNAVII
jgi:cation diffusion facilitator family transporter